MEGGPAREAERLCRGSTLSMLSFGEQGSVASQGLLVGTCVCGCGCACVCVDAAFCRCSPDWLYFTALTVGLGHAVKTTVLIGRQEQPSPEPLAYRHCTVTLFLNCV